MLLHGFPHAVAGALLATLAVSGCGGGLAPPVITDTSEPWRTGSQRRLTAAVNHSGAWEIIAVYARYTRHFWPGPAPAHEAVAEDDGGAYSAEPVEAKNAPRGDHLFYEWFADYRLADGGQEVLTARSGRRDFVVDCSAEDTAATLAQLRDFVLPYRVTNPHTALVPSGYLAAAHFDLSLLDVGVSFATAGALLQAQIAVGPPGVLLYTPRPQADAETAADHLAAVSDTAGPDEPYTLVGGAYGIVQTDARRRPSLGCIPSSAWFLHESGYHLQNGRMALRPPPEDVRGGTVVSALLPPPDAFAQPAPPNTMAWHPRLWDLHVWFSDDGAPPVISMYSPTPIPGVPPCQPMPTDGDCAGRIFFSPETWE